ncbi:MAG: PDZ domain-containing protein [Pseudomonadota bacterium]
MSKFTVLVIAVLGGACGSAIYAQSSAALTNKSSPLASAPTATSDATSVADLQARIEALELQLEQAASDLPAADIALLPRDDTPTDDSTDELTARLAEREQRRALWQRDPQAARRQMLARNGLRNDEIDRIMLFEQQRQVRELDADWDRRRAAYLDGSLQTSRRDGYFEELRAALGDDTFERYLSAQGAGMSVSNIIPGTAAEYSGLQTGDVIQAYNGARVYTSEQLNRLTVAGERGESVTIDVLRDGQTVTLSLPRGPIGVQTGGNRRFRRP